MIEAKMVKQEIKEIKEDNSTDINEQNIAKIVNLTGFPTIDIQREILVYFSGAYQNINK